MRLYDLSGEALGYLYYHLTRCESNIRAERWLALGFAAVDTCGHEFSQRKLKPRPAADSGRLFTVLDYDVVKGDTEATARVHHFFLAGMHSVACALRQDRYVDAATIVDHSVECLLAALHRLKSRGLQVPECVLETYPPDPGYRHVGPRMKGKGRLVRLTDELSIGLSPKDI